MTIANRSAIDIIHANARAKNECASSTIVSRENASGSVERSSIEESCGVVARAGSSSLLLHIANISRSNNKNPLPRADGRPVICCPSELPRSAPGIGWGHAATFAVPRGFACNVLARQTRRQPCKPSANGEPRGRQRNQRRTPPEVTTFCNFFQTATATSAASPPQCLARPSARAAPSPSPAAE